MKYELNIPIKTVSEANRVGEHWTKKSMRHKQQKKMVWFSWMEKKPKISLPCTITLCRISPRKLDEDNLLSSLKYIRDAVADQITPGLPPGKADDNELIQWKYSQAKGLPKSYGVKIEIDSQE